MTRPEKRIEETLWRHRVIHLPDGRLRCRCDFDCRVTFHDGASHERHVATAVVQALGLQQESRMYEKFETKSEHGGEGIFRFGGQTSRSVGWRTSTRLVSGWVES